jgi:hypothetical protein
MCRSAKNTVPRVVAGPYQTVRWQRKPRQLYRLFTPTVSYKMFPCIHCKIRQIFPRLQITFSGFICIKSYWFTDLANRSSDNAREIAAPAQSRPRPTICQVVVYWHLRNSFHYEIILMQFPVTDPRTEASPCASSQVLAPQSFSAAKLHSSPSLSWEQANKLNGLIPYRQEMCWLSFQKPFPETLVVPSLARLSPRGDAYESGRQLARDTDKLCRSILYTAPWGTCA